MQFWDIYYNYHDQVRKFICCLVKDEWIAEDLVQETFIKVQQNLNDLKDQARLSSWIFRIAHNQCLDYFRKSKTHCEKPVERIDKNLFIAPSVQQKMEQQQMSSCVQDQLRLLPESLRTTIILFEIMEFKLREIAEILDISVENVKVRLHRARKQLRAILSEKCEFEIDDRNVLICEPVEDK